MLIQAGEPLNAMTDITDGKLYRHLNKTFLSSEYSLSSTMNTDGVNLYSSSRIELWPIFLIINELFHPYVLQERI